VLHLARQLHGRRITVVTSNLAVLDELLDDEDVELVILSGVVRRNYRSLVGFLAEDALRQVRATRAFLGASAVRSDGSVMDSTMVEVTMKRGMVAAAEQVVLLADAAKFDGHGLARVCGPEDLDVVVTEADVPAQPLEAFERAGVRLLRA
jgi:DeoR/GlpR family transcriptional regulator of sugar metabolism